MLGFVTGISSQFSSNSSLVELVVRGRGVGISRRRDAHTLLLWGRRQGVPEFIQYVLVVLFTSAFIIFCFSTTETHGLATRRASPRPTFFRFSLVLGQNEHINPSAPRGGPGAGDSGSHGRRGGPARAGGGEKGPGDRHSGPGADRQDLEGEHFFFGFWCSTFYAKL